MSSHSYDGETQFALRILERIDGRSTPLDGSYVMGFDPDAHKGGGSLTITRQLKNALPFADRDAAMAFYETDSTTRPTRHDGKPNRPLARYAVDVVAIPR